MDLTIHFHTKHYIKKRLLTCAGVFNFTLAWLASFSGFAFAACGAPAAAGDDLCLICISRCPLHNHRDRSPLLLSSQCKPPSPLYIKFWAVVFVSRFVTGYVILSLMYKLHNKETTSKNYYQLPAPSYADIRINEPFLHTQIHQDYMHLHPHAAWIFPTSDAHSQRVSFLEPRWDVNSGCRWERHRCDGLKLLFRSRVKMLEVSLICATLQQINKFFVVSMEALHGSQNTAVLT